MEKISQNLFLPTNKQDKGFLPKVVRNAAVKTLLELDQKNIFFLFSGSATDVFAHNPNYNPLLTYDPDSDVDVTVLYPNEHYQSMEEQICNTKKCHALNTYDELDSYKIPKNIIFDKMSTVNEFPAPAGQMIFKDYNECNKYSNYTPFNLDSIVNNNYKDKTVPKDQGLFINLTEHFLKTGHLIGFDKKGKLIDFRISNNKGLFYYYVNTNNIYIPPVEPLPFSQKVDIWSSCIGALNKKNSSFHNMNKQFQRFVKYFMEYSPEDFVESPEKKFYVLGNDKNKINKPKFKELINSEKKFFQVSSELMIYLTKLKEAGIAYSSDIIKKIQPQLLKFNEYALKMKDRPHINIRF